MKLRWLIPIVVLLPLRLGATGPAGKAAEETDHCETEWRASKSLGIEAA
jgi:hypothetical protein